MSYRKNLRRKSALERRLNDVHHWMSKSVMAGSVQERENADRKLFLAQKDVRALNAKLGTAQS